MLPVIITQDYGKGNYGVIWGTFTAGIQAGVLLFNSLIFDHFYEKYNKDRWGRCTHPECFKSAFIIAGVCSLVGLILIIILYYMDRHDTTQGKEERDKLQTNAINSSDP
jgi:H+/Cl- antiporter ClcA